MPLHPEIASVVERRGRAGGSGRRREENSGVASPPLGGRIAWAAIIFATLALLPGAAGKGKEDLELVLSFHNRYHPTCTSDEGWQETLHMEMHAGILTAEASGTACNLMPPFQRMTNHRMVRPCVDTCLLVAVHCHRFLELPGEAGRSSPSIPEVPRQTPGALWAHAATSPLWPRAALLSYSPGAGSLLGLPGGIEKTEQFRR